MKMDTIKSLFTGRSFPCEAVSPKDKRYWTLLKEFHQQMERFMRGLSPEERDELECMQNRKQEATQYEIEEAFTQGYSLGVRMTAEAFLMGQEQEE